jgi:sucrose-6-phosphate hydrolase SacC (GH32 family)
LPALASYGQGVAEAVAVDQPWTQPSQGHLQGQVSGDQVLTLSNASGQSVVFTFEATKNRITVDRSASGDVSFSEAFAAAPMQMDWDNPADNTPVSFYLDASSIELFVGDGDQVMTLQVFPTTPWDRISVAQAPGITTDASWSWQPMRSIWEKH